MSGMVQTARLHDRAVIVVTGDEARPYLHRLLTQEVETLAEGELRFGAWLSPQGRVLNELFLLGTAEGVLLDVAAGDRDALVAKLKMFKLRAKVEIDADPRPVLALWDADGAPEGWLPDPRTPLAGWRRIGEGDAGDGDYRAHRLRLGLPDAAQDGLADKAYATEALLDLLGGVDYRKGCFVGQETTSRMKRRGGVRSRVLPLEVAGAAPGAEVLNGTLRAGEVVAADGGTALAVLRLDRLEGELTVDGAATRVVRPAWWPEEEAPFL